MSETNEANRNDVVEVVETALKEFVAGSDFDEMKRQANEASAKLNARDEGRAEFLALLETVKGHLTESLAAAIETGSEKPLAIIVEALTKSVKASLELHGITVAQAGRRSAWLAAWETAAPFYLRMAADAGAVTSALNAASRMADDVLATYDAKFHTP